MEKKKRDLVYLFKIVLFVGILLSCFAVVLYIVAQAVFRNQLNNGLALKKDSETLKKWSNPSSKVYRKYYFFDVQNPKEIQEGSEKPRIIERGPYVYREVKTNQNVTFHSDNILTYSPLLRLYFEPSLSIGNESDLITFVNMPAAAMIDKTIKEQSSFKGEVNFGYLGLNGIIDYLNVRLFLTKSVGEFLKGYNDQLLEFANSVMPSVAKSDKFSLLNGENDTVIENFTIMNGADDISNLGKLLKWNNLTKLKYWSTDDANMIQGKDPSLFTPFKKRDEIQRLYTSSLGRTLDLQYEKDAVIDDINTYEYLLKKDIFHYKKENEGYCNGNCLGNGVHDLNSITGAPSWVSQPHFLNADKKFLDALDGLKPNTNNHDFTANIDPVTGVPIKFLARLQANILLNGNRNIFLVRKLKTVLLPIMWAEVVIILKKLEQAWKVQRLWGAANLS